MTTKPLFTTEGVEVQTFEEIFEEMADDYRAIYGPDINLDQDSPDGQRVAIEARARLDVQSFGLMTYSQLDPDFSAGEMQNKIIKWAGITRRAATKSTATITVTTDRILTLATGYKIKDDAGQEWETISENVLAVGANSVTFNASEWGLVEAGAGTITEPVSIILGVLSVTNPAAATAGIDEETDEELRIRRNKSLENASYSTTGGLFAKLANLAGVTDLAVYENDTSTADQLRDNETGAMVPAVGMPANSLWCVLEGGANADIAEVIAKNKTGGTALRGAVTANYTEQINKPDGSTFPLLHVMVWDINTDIDLHVNVTATRKVTGQALDLALIREKIAEKIYSINDDAIATELYAFGYQAGTDFILTDMEISDDGITYTDDSLSSGFDETWLLDVANIVVTEVP